MKHTLLYIGLALASFMMQPAAVQAKTRKEAKVVKQLVVLHTNDTHSCVMPINPNLADTATANRGGFLRRVAMISQERKANPDLLLFDSGDFSQGSPYYSLFKGDVEVGLMNEMKYDAATIGNHEFPILAFSENIAASTELFEKKTGQSAKYHTKISGYHFITDVSVTSPDIEWIEDKVKEAVSEDKNKPVFVMLHDGFQNLILRSREYKKE